VRWTHVSPSHSRKAAAEFTRKDAFLPERVIAMPANGLIAWSDSKWNLVRGCSKISPGCKNCQAESYAKRFRDLACNQVDEIADVQLVPHNLLLPLRWLTSGVVFVSSRGDFFHKEVPVHFIVAAFEVMSRVNWHSYLVLTKRADRMRTMIESELQFAAKLDHIWWGVSVENKEHGLPRLSDLQKSPATVRFLSIEPLLEDLGRMNLSGIHWVIVGGESGHGARLLKKEWVTSIRDQCNDAGIPFFFKQWGGVQKKRAGRALDGQTYDGFPVRISNPVAPATTALNWAREIQDGFAASRGLLPVLA